MNSIIIKSIDDLKALAKQVHRYIRKNGGSIRDALVSLGHPRQDTKQIKEHLAEQGITESLYYYKGQRSGYLEALGPYTEHESGKRQLRRIHVRCKRCGNETTVTPQNFRQPRGNQSSRCSKCAKRKRTGRSVVCIETRILYPSAYSLHRQLNDGVSRSIMYHALIEGDGIYRSPNGKSYRYSIRPRPKSLLDKAFD